MPGEKTLPPPSNFPIMTMVWVVAWMRKASGVIEFILIMYNRERRILNNQVSNIDTYWIKWMKETVHGKHGY